MAGSTDDVLLSVAHVKNKKCDGSLCLLSERLAWMPLGKSSLMISYYYTDIKVQKISPDTKEKVQLQIVLHSSGANTFHFNNINGREAQLKDRETVKELLQQMLVKFKKQVNNDLEEKNRMLQEDPNLYQLYKSLVVGGVMSADEFWANRMSRPKMGEGSKQEIGVSADFLADIKHQVVHSNGARYNLTVDIIDSIFRAYPAVERKHVEYVPDRLSEQEFWYEFFQSHYFHQDRTNVTDKELFGDCIRRDEQIIRNDLELPLPNKSLDLQALFDLAPEESYEHLSRQEALVPVNTSLIRRFNQHSTMVLKSTECKTQRPKKDEGDACNSDILDKNRKRIFAELDEQDEETSGPALKLSKVEAYKHGPVPVTAMTYNTSDELFEAARVFLHDVMAWKPTPANQILSNTAALNVLWELSPTGILMQDSTTQQFNEVIPKEMQQELKSSYSGLCELLRHFWACFPVTTKELEDKVVRMEECLRRFQKSKIPAFSEKLALYRLTVDPTSHMNVLLDKAFSKFSSWQSRKTVKRN